VLSVSAGVFLWLVAC